MNKLLRFGFPLLFVFLSSNSSAVEFSLFGDVALIKGDHGNSFALGALDLIAEKNVSESLTVTADIIIQADDHGFEAETERFYITTAVKPYLNVTAGRFAQPLGLWNNNFHHASLAQGTVTRPYFLESDHDNKGVIPSHIVGVMASADMEDFSYQFAVGNATGINTEAFEPGEADLQTLNSLNPSGESLIALRGTYKLNFSTEIGFMYIRNPIVETADEHAEVITLPGAGTLPILGNGSVLFDQIILGLDFRYNADNYYVFAEFYTIDTKDNQSILYNDGVEPQISGKSGTYGAQAFYIQAGYHLTDEISLTYRISDVTHDHGATLWEHFLAIPVETRHTLATSYRLEESSVVRFELSHSTRSKTHGHAGDEMDITLQWIFLAL